MDPGAAHRPHTNQSRLRELQAGTTIVAALAFYDRLEPVGIQEMIGSWRGEGLPTGNPLDGLLERFGWYDKRFDGPDGAHPLVFDAGAGRAMLLNPAFVPITALIRYRRLLRAPFVPRLFFVVRSLLSTRDPKARLRLTVYRGVLTATLCYDALPINDVFRKVDDDTLVGAMDLRGLEMPFMSCYVAISDERSTQLRGPRLMPAVRPVGSVGGPRVSGSHNAGRPDRSRGDLGLTVVAEWEPPTSHETSAPQAQWAAAPWLACALGAGWNVPDLIDAGLGCQVGEFSEP